MSLFFSITSGNRGVAIVAVTMVMVVVALMGGAIIAQTNQDVQLSNRAVINKQAVYIAESAKERGYQEILDDENFTTMVNPGILARVSIQGGSYDLRAVTLSADPKIVQFIATGTTSGGESKEIEVVAEVLRENVQVWNNAIFGGSGQTGGVISGNVAIHGSVHLMGENVGVGNNSISALDMTGASMIHNNYVGISAALEARLPALPTTVIGGETVATLESKLRVKNGAVGVSGSTELGELDLAGNALKETLDGIYIETSDSDIRWTGTEVIDGVPNPKYVQSDNGVDALYDLEDAAVQMPSLDSPYKDPVTDVMYATYADYCDAGSNALELDIDELVLDSSDNAYNELKALKDAGNLPDAKHLSHLEGGDGFVISDNGTNVLIFNPTMGKNLAGIYIQGVVKINGDLAIGQKNLKVTYKGDGTIFAAGNGTPASVDGSFTPGAGNVDIHSNLLPERTFPTDDVLGLMAKTDIGIATGAGDSQLMMAGAFFAGRKITSAKQNEIAGTFVCEYFDMGKNVPKLYQVPALADNLPSGMVSSEPIWVITGFVERSWQIRALP